MPARRLLPLLTLAAFALFCCAGCAGLKPDHLVVGIERDEAETNGPTRQRTGATKVDAHAVYDLTR